MAEGDAGSVPALGRALRFVVFDILDGVGRSPCYRVRPDYPGQKCTGNEELMELLDDCEVVIAGSAGPRLREQMRARGTEVVLMEGGGPPEKLVERLLAGESGAGGH